MKIIKTEYESAFITSLKMSVLIYETIATKTKEELLEFAASMDQHKELIDKIMKTKTGKDLEEDIEIQTLLFDVETMVKNTYRDLSALLLDVESQN